MLIAALLISVLVALLRGGDISRLGAARFRGLPLYMVAFVLQLLLQKEFFSPGVAAGSLYVLSFALLIGGAWLDRQIPGIVVAATGLVLNGLAVSLNGGKMPVFVSESTMRASGVQALTHSAMSQATRVWLLGDIIRIPLWGGHSTLLSAGDIALIVGIFILIQRQIVPR